MLSRSGLAPTHFVHWSIEAVVSTHFLWTLTLVIMQDLMVIDKLPDGSLRQHSEMGVRYVPLV